MWLGRNLFWTIDVLLVPSLCFGLHFGVYWPPNRLIQFGVQVDALCVFCGVDLEDIIYMFFDYFTIGAGWSVMLQWYGFSFSLGDCVAMVTQLCCMVKGRAPRRRVFKVVCAEFIYDVWLGRNQLILNNVVVDWNALLRQVVQNVVAYCLLDAKLAPVCHRLAGYPCIQLLWASLVMLLFVSFGVCMIWDVVLFLSTE